MLQTNNKPLHDTIKKFQSNKTAAHFTEVLKQLQNKETLLTVPVKASESPSTTQWSTLKKGDSLTLQSVFSEGNEKTLLVFTSPQHLQDWAQTTIPYKIVAALDLLELAQDNGINRIIIDYNQDTEFVLENQNSQTKPSGSIEIWHPEIPIAKPYQMLLTNAFQEIKEIESVYHFGITHNEEKILLLAFTLLKDTQKVKKAIIKAVKKNIQDYPTDFPLDVLFMKPHDEWHVQAEKMLCIYKNTPLE